MRTGEFLNEPCYYNSNGKRIRMREELFYRIDKNGTETIKVPAGFECDGQSYPRLLWAIDTPQGDGLRAGIVHDYLYHLNGRPVPDLGLCFDREAADQVYREALVASGVHPFKAWVRWKGLRFGGWKAWNVHAKRIKAEAAQIMDEARAMRDE